jgi:hypothetical protein
VILLMRSITLVVGDASLCDGLGLEIRECGLCRLECNGYGYTSSGRAIELRCCLWFVVYSLGMGRAYTWPVLR